METTNKRGRPKKFKNPKQMQEAIDLYFEYCDEEKKPYTVEGLCMTLEVDRKTLLNYEKLEANKDFSHIVKRAKIKIQQNLVERGLMGQSNSTLSVFLLKNNYGYEDKTQSDVNLNNAIKVKFGE